MNEQAGIRIGKKAFITSAVILLLLMLCAGILTAVLPQGSFERTEVDGREMVVPGSYHSTLVDRLPVWRYLTAPFEVLVSPDASMVVVIMLYILLIGGTFLVLEKAGILRYIMSVTVKRYGQQKYKLLAAMVFLFMLFGSTIGIFEELITLVPLGVALALSLGWDSLMGIGMTGMAVGFGFAAGTLNPFTVGVAQRVSELPAFSGLWLRAAVFLIVFALVYTFLYRYAKRIEANPARSLTYEDDNKRRGRLGTGIDEEVLANPNIKRAVKLLGLFLCAVIAYILAGVFFPALSDYSLPVMAVLFTAGGIAAGTAAKYGKSVMKDFLTGCLSFAPGLLLIAMAMSVKEIIVNGGVLDTLLYYASQSVINAGPYASVLLVYGFVLLMEFFVGSGSAKAVLIMPIIAPLADLVGFTRQSAVLAFIFGDGFTNLFFPTNPVLLIILALTGISYGKWFKWTWKLQLAILGITTAILCFAVSIGYGPY